MKATELKIGDWVSYKGKPAKVHSLDMPFIYIFDVADEVYGLPDGNENLIPLPLTAEILEKNGWINDGCSYDYQLNERLYLINAEYKDKKCKEIEIVEVHSNISPYSDDVCQDDFYLKTVSAVHELQHLLWALGMDDNLKI